MALTTASFVPEKRKGGGGSGGGNSGGGPNAAAMMGDGYNHATDAAMTAMHESMPANHPVTGTALPRGTGAGMGTVHKGGRGGK